MKTALRTCLVLVSMAVTNISFAWQPNEVLADPALELRARDISAQLRCLVCQNQSIDGSDADLAKDLRLLVRERLTAGDTDDQVYAFLVARYGQFILLRPRFGWRTALLWGLPSLLLMIGIGVLWVSSRKRRTSAPNDKLSIAEKARLSEIIDGQ